MKIKNHKRPYWLRLIRGVGVFFAGVILLLSLTLLITTVSHKMSLKSEAKRIESYGEKIKIFDGEVTVVDEGHGPETIILLPGQGTASPYLDFKPLINELKKDFRVVTIEPFGYGLSSQTDRERSVANIVEEIHEVTKSLGLKKYIVMGHSIAGLYGVNYAQQYPSEMTAFVGIDSSTPEQPWPGINLAPIDFLKETGVFRALIKANPESVLGVDKAHPDFEQIRLLTLKNMSSRNLKEELQMLDKSFPESRGLTYPSDMPVLLFVAKNDLNQEGWLDMHQAQLVGVKRGKLFELPGKHYLHHTQTPKIVKETKAFLTEKEV